MSLRLSDISRVNLERCKRWHPGFPDDEWTGADWSNAMCGEAGELANIVKKLRRQDLALANTGDPPRAELLVALGKEVADVYLYLDLLAAYYGIDVGAAVVQKFNEVSERQGFPERLSNTIPSEVSR